MARYAMIALVLVFVMGCRERPDTARKFHRGQIVESVISGVRGQVTSSGHYPLRPKDGWFYWVTFANTEVSVPHHILGSGGALTAAPLATVRLWEFELRECAE